MTRVRTGLERLVETARRTAGGRRDRVGLVTNPTGVLPDLTPAATALLAAGVRVTTLLSPEHGLRGTAQAGHGEHDSVDPVTGLPVRDVYQRSGQPLVDLLASCPVDTLVIDLADVGTRFYTYVWTMHDLMAAAACLRMRCIVLDRPNPVGGVLREGPLLDPAFASLVGRAPIAIRHGLTIGEIALFVNRVINADLEVIPLLGWRREQYFDHTGLPWVMPSANMPTLDTALWYPGTGLLEGTNLSEGRGTTRPFELVGAPYVDGRLAAALNDLGLPGVRFRDAWFTPVFGKHAGTPVRGVQPHVVDRDAVRPVRTGVHLLHLLATLYPGDFACDPFLDLLWGSDWLRRTLQAGQDPGDGEPTDGPGAPAAGPYSAPPELLYR